MVECNRAGVVTAGVVTAGVVTVGFESIGDSSGGVDVCAIESAWPICRSPTPGGRSTASAGSVGTWLIVNVLLCRPQIRVVTW